MSLADTDTGTALPARGSTDPPPVRHAQLPELAQVGLGVFAAGLTTSVLLLTAGSTLLTALAGGGWQQVGVYSAAAAVSAVGGVSLLTNRPRIPGARYLALAAAALGLVVAVWAPGASHAAGLPAEAVILAGLVTLTAAVAMGVRPAAVLVVALSLLLGTQFLTERAADAAAVTPLSAGLIVMKVLLAGGVSLLLVLGLRRSAARAGAAAALLDDGMARERAAAAAEEADAEAARTLHDTALNTLEAISKGGAALDPQMVRARCRADLKALRQWHDGAASADLKSAMGELDSHARNLGIELEFRVGESADRADLPPEVSAAFIRASRELVTNVAKHSGTDHAEVRVWHDAEGLWVTVADRGVGLGGRGTGTYGLADSVVSRMAAVGGQVTFAPGPDGVGTSCELHWSAVPPEEFELEPVNLNSLAAWIFTWAGVLAAAVSVLVVLLGWASFQQPWIAMAAALVSGIALLAAGYSLRRGYQPGVAAVLAVVMTYLTLSWAALLADPVCASVSEELVGLDARLFLLAVVLLFLPRFSQAAVLVGAVAAGQLLTAWLWHSTFELCGASTRNAGLVIAAILLAIWWFGRLAASLSADFGRTRAQALALAVRTSCSEQARLERQRWAQDALAGAERILVGLVAGTAELGSPDLARRCNEESGFLRGMLLVGAAPREQARAMRRWLGRLRRAGLQVVVRGNYRGFHPPRAIAAEVEDLVAQLTELHGPGRVSLFAWGGAGDSGLSMEAQIARVASLAELPRLGLVDVAEGSLTVVWDWQGGGPQGGASHNGIDPLDAGTVI